MRTAREAECHAVVSAAAGRDVGDEELKDIMERVQGRMQSRRAAGDSPDIAARTAGTQVATEARIRALVEKRERAIAVGIKNRLIDDRTIPKQEYRSLMGATTGDVHRGRFLGGSADAVAKGMVERRIGDLLKPLYHEGLIDLLTRKDPILDREITQELWHIKRGEPATTNKQARRIAEIFDEHMEITRLALNEEGAWIGKLEHYVGRQMHDMYKIRDDFSDAAFHAWRDFIYPRLDPITFDHIVKMGGAVDGIPKTVNDFLYDVWKALSTGKHEKSEGGSWLGGFHGPSNLAKRLSQERVLHFKDPVGFWEYNQKFGHGTVLSAVIRSIERGAHSTGLMKVFGPNPGAMVEWYKGALSEQAYARKDAKMGTRIDNVNTKQLVDRLTGAANLPENMSLAYYAQGARNIQHMSKLWGVVASSLPDIASQAGVLRANGVPLAQGWAHALASTLPNGSAARTEFLIQAGGLIHGFLNDLHVRIRAEDAPIGALGGMTNTYFKAVGQDYWTVHQRTGTQTGIAASYAHMAHLPFEKLDGLVKITLERFGLDGPWWEAMRKVPTKAADGNRYLFPGDVPLLSDADVAHLGPNPARSREELHTRYQTLLTDQAREALSEPTAGHSETLAFHTRPGTKWGEVIRSMMMFKTFAFTFVARNMGRTFHRGETPVNIGGLHLNVDIPGIANLVIGTTFLGGLGLMIKDLLSGRSMRDVSDLAGAARFLGASMAAGGGGGIAADFLLGNVYGESGRGGVGGLIGGPIFGGTLDDIKKMIDSAEGGHGNIPAQLIQWGKSNQPFKLPYTKAALDYLIYWGLQEKVNPGYLYRVEQKARRDYKQEYWLRPTQAVRY